MTPSPSRTAGVTLVELLVAVSVTAIIAAGVVPLFRSVPEAAISTKLQNDVATINQAVDVYRAYGGSLASVETPQEVIEKLKTRADAQSSLEMAGLTGSMIDPRVDVVMQNAREASSDQPRAVWNSEALRLEIQRSGSNGVKAFSLNNEIAALPQREEVRLASMKLASQDKWIWDYDDKSSDGRRGPTPVDAKPAPTKENPTPAAKPPTEPKPKPKPGSKQLKAPVISIPSGEFPITQFNLPIYLYNENPGGVSRVIYSVNGAGWKVYDGTAIQASPGYSVTAYAEAIDPAWRNSKYAKEKYGATPVELDAPLISSSAPQFDFDTNKIVTVTLENPNKAGVSEMEYRASGTQWARYNGSFRMHVDSNPIGAVIEARAVPAQAYYLESDVSYLNIDKPAPWFSISGGSEGSFYDPVGTESLASNLMGGVTSEFFTWGVPTGTDSPSLLQFEGAEFFDISPGERFLVGVLDYYNGTIASGSGASAVDFSVDLGFEGYASSSFEFTLDLINSRNNTGTPEGDADYVLFGNLASEAPTTIGGNDFNLILEFGETTDGGFSTVDQFHVFEDARATGNLYARLELVQ